MTHAQRDFLKNPTAAIAKLKQGTREFKKKKMLEPCPHQRSVNRMAHPLEKMATGEAQSSRGSASEPWFVGPEPEVKTREPQQWDCR